VGTAVIQRMTQQSSSQQKISHQVMINASAVVGTTWKRSGLAV